MTEVKEEEIQCPPCGGYGDVDGMGDGTYSCTWCTGSGVVSPSLLALLTSSEELC